jgi:hypothetical protein
MILIDTAPLVALYDPTDALNKTAINHLKTLSREHFALCEPVLTEVCCHLSTSPQRKRLYGLLQRLGVTSLVPADPLSFLG